MIRHSTKRNITTILVEGSWKYKQSSAMITIHLFLIVVEIMIILIAYMNALLYTTLVRVCHNYC